MRLLLPVVLAALVVACGSSFLGSSSKATQCPGSQTTCLTAPACSWDNEHGCQICHCSAPDVVPDQYLTPQGPLPSRQ